MKSSAMFNLTLDKTFPEKTDKGEPVAAIFKTVAKDVCLTLHNLIKGAELIDARPISCFVSSESVPRTDATTDPKKIKIGLALPKESLVGLDYSRFVYQLGHELGHVIIGPLRTNGLIETLADAISYEALDRMTYLWKMKYRNSHPWRQFAPEFMKYREKTEQQLFSGLPQKIQDAISSSSWAEITMYLRDNLPELEANITDAKGLSLRSLGAKILRAHELPWKDIVGVSSLTNPNITSDNKYRDDLQINIAQFPDILQKALTRIGR